MKKSDKDKTDGLFIEFVDLPNGTVGLGYISFDNFDDDFTIEDDDTAAMKLYKKTLQFISSEVDISESVEVEVTEIH